MMIKTRLFSKSCFVNQPGLHEILVAHEKKLRDEIMAIVSPDALTEEFLARFVKESLVEPLTLHLDQITQDPPRFEVVDDCDPAFSFRIPGHDKFQRLVVRISIPFSGHPDLLHYSPNETLLNPPTGQIVGNKIQFDAVVKGGDGEAGKTQGWIEENKNSLMKCVHNSTEQITKFNESLPEKMKAVFSNKVKELNDQMAVLEGLGFSLSEIKSSPLTSPVPVSSKKKATGTRVPPNQVIQYVSNQYISQANIQINQTNHNSGDVNNAVQSG